MRLLLPLLLCACSSTPELGFVITVRSETTIPVGEQRRFDIESLDESMPFRVSLFAGEQLSDGDGTLRFEDADGDGVADRGAPMERAFLDGYADNLDTMPEDEDDPADPTGLYYQANSGWKHQRQRVTGVQAGTVWLVVHENGGLSTHLEVDDNGKAMEPVTALQLTIVE